MVNVAQKSLTQNIDIIIQSKKAFIIYMSFPN